MTVLELRKTEKPLPARGSGFWLGDCRLVVAHPNAYLGTLHGRFTIDKQDVFIEFDRVEHVGQRGLVKCFFDVRKSEYVEPGHYDFDTITRICHRKDLRKANEKLWRERADQLHLISVAAYKARPGIFQLLPIIHQPSTDYLKGESDPSFLAQRLEAAARITPVDIPLVTNLVGQAYGVLGLTPPPVVLKSSPAEAATEISKISYQGVGSLNYELREACFGPDAPAFGAMWLDDNSRVSSEREERLRRELGRNAYLGGWGFTQIDCHHAIAARFGNRKNKLTELWLQLLSECTGCWLHEDVCIVSDFPAEIHLDDQWRLHNLTGPALRWRDDSKHYYLNGIKVPARVIEAPHTLTPQQILEYHNVEVRRIMLGQFGLERLLIETNASALQEDETGVLYSVPLDSDEPLTIVKVRNSTPEPDGSYKFYYLRVPPTVRTAREGVAWTFDMNAPDYKPKVET